MSYKVWQYAALSEYVYRRAAADQALELSDIVNATSYVFTTESDAFLSEYGVQTSNDGFVIQADNGLTALVVRDSDGTFTVVFRGTDSNTTDGAAIGAAAVSGNRDPSDLTLDEGDWFANVQHGTGAYNGYNRLTGEELSNPSQWETAKALVDHLLNDLSGGDTSKVIVAGQSLGGGLASLASVVFDVEGYAFGPAPFGNQLKIEAEYAAISDLITSTGSTNFGIYADIFTSEFESLSAEDQTYLLLGNDFSEAVLAGAVAASGISGGAFNDAIAALTSAFAGISLLNFGDRQERFDLLSDLGFIDPNNSFGDFDYFMGLLENILVPSALGQFTARAESQSHLFISSVNGEFTTNQPDFRSLVGTLIDISSEDIRDSNDYNVNYDLGDLYTSFFSLNGEEFSRHSPALHALLALSNEDPTEQSDQSSFADLVQANRHLYYNLFVDTSIAAPDNDGKTPAVSGDPSATYNPEMRASVEPLYRALWKSLQDAKENNTVDDSFYTYFETLFTSTLTSGAVSAGIDIDPRFTDIDTSFNAEVTRLLLGVLRDAVDNTSTLAEFESKLGGIEFAGELDAGFIHVSLSDITSTQTDPDSPNDGHIHALTGRPAGAQGIDFLVGDLIVNSILSDNSEALDWLDINLENITQASDILTDWETLVVQAGEDGGSIEFDGLELAIDGSTLLIAEQATERAAADNVVLGAGDDWVLTGHGNDIVDAGDGDNVVISSAIAENESDATGTLDVLSGEGNDLIIGGAGDDKIRSGFGQDLVDAGAGNDSIEASGHQSLLFAGGGDDQIRSFGDNSVIEAEEGDDYVYSVGAGAVVFGGDGDDYIQALGNGSVVYGGDGSDSFLVGGNATLVQDASNDDQVVFSGIVLNGTVGWGDASEKESLIDFKEGVEYSINHLGELIVSTLDGARNLFVAGYDHDDNNIGIRLTAVTFTAYQLLDPAYPGAAAYFSGIADIMDEVYFRLYGTERTATDPLVLDLDGDGIELAAMSSISPFFDLDSDGYAERAGWTTGDDGFLAIDLNQDGQINDITELFGDRTTSGFDALAVHDLNADGVIDANDTVFADLRVWQDLDSDGETDAGELTTLADRGIDSINLTPTNENLVNMSGNEIAAEGSYTLADGTTQGIFDVRLRTDELNTLYLGDTTVSAAAATLPDAKGYGELPSLHIAATQDSNVLTELQAAQSSLNTPVLSDLISAVRPLANAWSQYDGAPLSSNMGVELDYSYTIEPDGSILIQDQVLSVTTSGTEEWYLESDFIAGSPVAYATEADAVQALHTAADAAGYSYASSFQPVKYYSYVIDESGRVEITNMIWYDPPANSNDDPEWKLSGTGESFSTLGAAQLGLAIEAAASDGFVSTFSQEQLHVLEQFSGEDVPFNELNERNSSERSVMIDYMEVAANIELQIAMTVSAQSGLSSFFSQVEYDAGEDLFSATTPQDLTDTYQTILDVADDEVDAAAYLSEWAPYLRLFLSQFDRGSDALKNSYSYQFANLVRGFETFASYPISIEAAADALAIPGVTLAAGTDDADIFYLSTTAGTFEGGAAPDNYVVGSNFANHLIDDRELVLQDAMGGDVIRFASHSSTDVSVSRVDNDLLLTDLVTGNTITVAEQFLRARPSLTTGVVDDDRGVVEIIFADGVVWDKFDIAKAAAETDASDQTIIGTRSTDWFDGGEGDDYYLGGNSADFYIFGAGDGNDVIYEYGPEQKADNAVFVLIEERDWVIFDDDIVFEDLTFDRSENLQDLIVTHVPSGASLTIKEQFVATNTGPLGLEWFNRIELFSFESDGRLLTDDDVMDMMLEGTSGDDTITGFYRQDTMTDTAGDDTYSGGDDGDTYIFARNGGANTIEENQSNVITTTPDKIVFSGDIDPSEVNISRVPNTNDLMISLDDGSTSILVKGQFSYLDTGPFGIQWFDRVESIEFQSDPNTVWTYEDIMARLLIEAKTDGDDLIEGFYRDDTLDGGLGDDTLDGGELSDTYIYDVGYGNDTISEVDWSFSGAIDKVSFGAGVTLPGISVARDGSNLVLTLDSSGETLTIIEQHDRQSNGATPTQIEEFHFTDGTMVDAEYWRALDIQNQMTTGDDFVVGFAFDDALAGGQGNDRLEGGAGSDTYAFNLGDGTDTILESSVMTGVGINNGDDTVQFGAGLNIADLTLSRSGNDVIFSFSGGETLILEDQVAHEWLYVVDHFEFADGTVWTAQELNLNLLAASTTSGDDLIGGYSWSDDILEGGTGDDRLEGGGGSDTYIFNLGDGNDVIYDGAVTGVGINNGDDTVLFGAGLNIADLTLSRAGDDLIFSFAGGDTVTIENQFAHAWLYTVDHFEFADGTVWSSQDVQNQLLTSGATPGDDIITGFDADDILAGGAGNDRLVGKSGDDLYLFNSGDGDDVIFDHHLNTTISSLDMVRFGVGLDQSNVTLGRNGGDLIFTFDTGDTLTIEQQFDHSWLYKVESFEFADGSIWTEDQIATQMLADLATAGDETIVGFDRDDVLTGGAGTDRLVGKSGDDLYLFNVGDGHDTIFDHHVATVMSSIDTVQFGAGLSVNDVIVRKQGDDLTFSFPTGDTLTVEDVLRHSWLYVVENYEFEDGTVWTLDDVKVASLVASDGDDLIEGYGSDDALSGGLGSDTLIGLSGSDTYSYAVGDQNLTIDDRDNASSSTDILNITGGVVAADLVIEKFLDDLIITMPDGSVITVIDQFRDEENWGLETITFDDGSSLTAADILSIVTVAYVPSVVGTSGNDLIEGTSGDDIIEAGLGSDLVHGLNGSDTYIFKAGDGVDEIDDNGNYDTDILVIQGYSPADVSLTRMTATGHDLLITFAGSSDQITVWNTLSGSRYDEIEEIHFDDGTVWTMSDVRAQLVTQQQTTGNDTINGFVYSDTLEGGLGDDTLHGGDGSDTYIFKAGDGVDEIEENGNYDTDILVIQGYSPSDVTLTRTTATGHDLLITFAGSSDQITVWNTLSGSRYDEIEEIHFDDGTVWTMSDVRAQLIDQQQTSGNDTIDGFVYDDTLEGGLGDDVVHGGDGSDSYIFNAGDGIDEIEDNGNRDTDKLFINGYSPADVTLTRTTATGHDLLITFAGSSDQITVWNTLSGNRYDEIEEIHFDDGTVWTMSDVRAQLVSQLQTTGNDTIEGFVFDDTLEGGLGNDIMHGGDGSDIYVFNAGDGIDEIEDNGNRDTDEIHIRGVVVADVIMNRASSGSADLIITFANSSDQITVRNTLNGDRYDEIERIVFDDGTIWDATEIRNQADSSLPPIIFDLDDDGLYFRDQSISFDFDSDTQIETGAWIDQGDAILALDRDGDGQISSGAEISFVSDLPGAMTDLEGLAAFDTNGDGLFSAADEQFSEFVIWTDANGDGVSQDSELQTVTDAGLLALSLSSSAFEGAQPNANATIFGETVAVFSDGRSIDVADAALDYAEVSAEPFEVSSLDARIEAIAAHFDALMTETRGSFNTIEPYGFGWGYRRPFEFFERDDRDFVDLLETWMEQDAIELPDASGHVLSTVKQTPDEIEVSNFSFDGSDLLGKWMTENQIDLDVVDDNGFHTIKLSREDYWISDGKDVQFEVVNSPEETDGSGEPIPMHVVPDFVVEDLWVELA